jgi:hypothetical protein
MYPITDVEQRLQPWPEKIRDAVLMRYDARPHAPAWCRLEDIDFLLNPYEGAGFSERGKSATSAAVMVNDNPAFTNSAIDRMRKMFIEAPRQHGAGDRGSQESDSEITDQENYLEPISKSLFPFWVDANVTTGSPLLSGRGS